MKKRRHGALLLTGLIAAAFSFALICGCAGGEEEQTSLTLEEYLETSGGEWFRTGKKDYMIKAMMVSRELSFHNELEVTDYTVTDDGRTVVLKGTRGEMWTSPLAKVVQKYTRPDGSELCEADFSVKDAFIDIRTIPAPNAYYAMFVPKRFVITLETAWGDVLHTNLPNAPHGEGDFLVCGVGEDGGPDLGDVWVVNGELFADCYDTTNRK